MSTFSYQTPVQFKWKWILYKLTLVPQSGWPLPRVPLNQGGPPCPSPAWPPGPRQGWAAGSDCFWLLELRVSRTGTKPLRGGKDEGPARRHWPLATPSSPEKALDQSGQGLGLVLKHVMPGLLEAMDVGAGKAPGPLVQKGLVEDEVAHSPANQDRHRRKLFEAVLDPGNQVIRAISGS